MSTFRQIVSVLMTFCLFCMYYFVFFYLLIITSEALGHGRPDLFGAHDLCLVGLCKNLFIYNLL